MRDPLRVERMHGAVVNGLMKPFECGPRKDRTIYAGSLILLIAIEAAAWNFGRKHEESVSQVQS